MHGIYKARDVHVPLVCWFGIVQCPTRQLYTYMYGLWLSSRDSVARHKQNKNNSCIRLDTSLMIITVTEQASLPSTAQSRKIEKISAATSKCSW